MPVLQSVKLTPGTSGLYRDVSNIIFAKRPAILHTSHRLMSQKQNGNHIQAVIRGPSETPAVVRVFTAGKEVESINVHDSQGKELKPDIQTEGPTLRVQFPNDPDGATLELRLK
jgi:hypothetical protein